MNSVAAQLANTNMVYSTNASQERKQKQTKHNDKKRYGAVKQQSAYVSFNQVTTWDHVERRSGNDRRLEDQLAVKRLGSRNKHDRRANGLSIQI